MTIFAAETTLRLIRVPTTAVLQQVDVSSYPDGTLAYVSASQSYYCRQSLLQPNGGTILSAANGPGGWAQTFTVTTS